MIFKKLLLIFALFCTQAFAWEPTKPITAYVGFPPGSGDDTVIRNLSSIVEKQNPQVKFTINNRPGASGIVDLNAFVGKPNDGQHLKVIGRGAFTFSHIVDKGIVKYQESDFDKVLTMAASPVVAVVSADSPLNNLVDLKNLIKSSSTPILISSSGGMPEVVLKYFIKIIDVTEDKVTIVNYKGPVEQQVAVAQKETKIAFVPLTTAINLRDSGKTKFISIFSESKIKDFASVPLARDFDKNLVFYSSWGIGLPKNTAKEIRDWFEEKFTKAIQSEEAKSFYNSSGLVVIQSELTSAGYTAGVGVYREKFEKVLE
jgi:tripartite-type tricarboxylate transporter receptor subunit TctC